MKMTMKKLLALLMALAMCLSLCVPVWATEESAADSSRAPVTQVEGEDAPDEAGTDDADATQPNDGQDTEPETAEREGDVSQASDEAEQSSAEVDYQASGAKPEDEDRASAPDSAETEADGDAQSKPRAEAEQSSSAPEAEEQASTEPPGTTPRPDYDEFRWKKSDGLNVQYQTVLEMSDQLMESFLRVPADLLLWSDDYFLQTWELYEEGGKIQYTEEIRDGLRARAKEITADCNTDGERIKAVAYYVAEHIAYDNDYYKRHIKEYPDIDPYTVLRKGYTVCAGYARTCEYLLQCLGIPCVYVDGYQHAFNFAYDGTRWVLFDATYMSRIYYNNGAFSSNKSAYPFWYDVSYDDTIRERINGGDGAHTIYKLPYSEQEGVLLHYPEFTRYTDIYIPASVTSIGHAAFDGCTNLTSMTIPGSVKSIEGAAFIGCTGLTSVTISEGVERIEANAFDGSTGLTSVTIPGSVSTIGDSAFWGCKRLTDLTICDGVENIGDDAFHDCTGLTSVTIPGSVSTIGGGAFWGCTSLTDLTICDGVKRIGENALDKCPSLTSVTIPGSVSTIESGTFTNWNYLTSVTFSEGVETIESHAFSGYRKLKSVTIPSSVKSIHYDAIYPGRMKKPKVTIYGYTGSAAETYAEERHLTFVALDAPSKTSLTSVSARKGGEVRVKWKRNSTGTGYQLQYAADKKFKNKAKSVTIKKNETTSHTVKKLKKGTWYFRIRTVKGKSSSGWSAVKSVKVTK